MAPIIHLCTPSLQYGSYHTLMYLKLTVWLRAVHYPTDRLGQYITIQAGSYQVHYPTDITQLAPIIHLCTSSLLYGSEQYITLQTDLDNT